MTDYLGDAVYATTDDVGRMILTTNSHVPQDAESRICIEPEVWDAMKRFVARASQSKETNLIP
jgi:hypothetical protein